MKRRNTVSVTPAMGARTVAGERRTLPMLKDAGKSRAVFDAEHEATGVSPVPGAAGAALSQYFCTL
jgi:hypothetical protein